MAAFLEVLRLDFCIDDAAKRLYVELHDSDPVCVQLT
jgi:hypothetical protein